MKRISFFALIAVLLCITVCSCSHSTDTGSTTDIALLESKLADVSEANARDSAKIDELISQISKLSPPSDTVTPQVTAPPSSDAETSVGFTYTVSDGTATLTGYSGSEKALVLPASIDGYRVTAVADSAFADSFIESVIISEGIQCIGWFAFNGCVKLRSITVPSSVTSIGYGALGSADSPITVYCHSNSFALKYAKSYGLTYTVI